MCQTKKSEGKEITAHFTSLMCSLFRIRGISIDACLKMPLT